MENRYLFRAKRIDNGKWVEGDLVHSVYKINDVCVGQYGNEVGMHEVDPSTICQCTGIKDKNGKLIWENDILMCHGNPEDLVKAVFGEFNVINAETLEAVDRVIGWHYEVVSTDALSKCEPFCLPMPLTEEYVKRCEMEIAERVAMTENEKLVRDETEAIECLKSNKPTSGYLMLQESIDMAIKALEEVQQYRAIGTLEKCRAVMEKQTAISRELIEGKYFCPKCHNLMPYPGYCGCGQKVY